MQLKLLSLKCNQLKIEICHCQIKANVRNKFLTDCGLFQANYVLPYTMPSTLPHSYQLSLSLQLAIWLLKGHTDSDLPSTPQKMRV